MTKVSIITPTYNPNEYDFLLTERSIGEQTSQDFEWIMVDDGSEEYSGWADVHLARNFGPSVARNVGFQISSGKYIIYADLGDELAPNRVENVIELFEQYNIDLLFSSYDIVEKGNRMRLDHLRTIGRHSRFPDALEYSKLLNYGNISIPLGVAHTRKPFVEAGGFQRGIVCGEDGVLWRRMYNHLPGNRVMFSDDFAGTYFVSQDGQSRTQRRFDMGGFAIDGSLRDNGRYLDKHWFEEYSSGDFYEPR